MSKAHEEGGDMTSSEHLASAFLLLGMTETSEDQAVECENESEPLTVTLGLYRNRSVG